MIEIDDEDITIIISALVKRRAAAARRGKASLAGNWKPEPGKIDINKKDIERVDRALANIYRQRSGKGKRNDVG